jgi:hypothetical protein
MENAACSFELDTRNTYSYALHEVMPVTKGERNSLVSWITGKPFK